MPRRKQPHPPDGGYRDYKFRIKWDGRIVAGIHRVSPLRRTVAVIEYRQGTGAGATQKLPGSVRYEPITLERGITHDSAFENWANQVTGTTAGPTFRKEVRLEVYDAHDRLVVAYNIHRCWPTEYTALGGLDSSSDSHPFQSLTLENEGWERDITAGRHSRRRRPRP
jgi:phage tail-like protein